MPLITTEQSPKSLDISDTFKRYLQIISKITKLIIIPAGPTQGGSSSDVLYIAMAGAHQIWSFYLKDSSWLKGGSVINLNESFHFYQ